MTGRHFIVLLYLLPGAANGQGMWELLAPSLKAIELAKFCDQHPGHQRCKELEAQRTYCAMHPMDAAQCDSPAAGNLLQQCESNESADRASCEGVLVAKLDTGAAPQLKPIDNLFAPEPALACVPVPVLQNPEQLRLLFIREANRHPEVLHLSARRLLFYALAKTFPCSNPLKEHAK